ncbi:Diacylglycerol kinase theta [Harpegnathos saltator]|uniref:Diacylglycerol kinase n=1 Tax=Harpegnathos saltator TaxID=610380 RepID=E2C7N0_HARSA|nr:Diacylglycerol kinase theta [Harpegnathos saltator]
MASVSAETPASHGHSFSKKTFHKPTYCHSCTDMLWGLIQQGYICEVCNFVVHDRCLKAVVSPCSSIAASLIKNPVAHCWSEQVHQKRKFCNVCRKRLDDNLSIHCEICEYFVHIECQDFALADCKENATYFLGKDLAAVRHTHHWREGNLPSSSKCAVCKKGCCSAECLSGFRCEWCGMTLHAYCYKNIPQECTFGNLEPIYLPPHAVSIPRTEVPMEAIIGVQVRRKEVLAREYSCLFHDLTIRGIIAFYMDDLIIPSIDLQDGLSRLKLLKMASEHGLLFNWKKCQMLKSKVEYLEHIIESEKVTPSDEKTNAVKHFPKPTTDDGALSTKLFRPNRKTAINMSWLKREKRKVFLFFMQGEYKRLERVHEVSPTFFDNYTFRKLFQVVLTLYHIIPKRYYFIANSSQMKREKLFFSWSPLFQKSNISLSLQIVLVVPNIVPEKQFRKSKHKPSKLKKSRSISEEFSSDTRCRDNGEPAQCAHSRDPRSPKEKDDKERGDEEMIKVYDGNNSLRRRIFQVISVPRQATTEEVLTSALHAFHITKDPNNFYLTDLYATDETELCDPTPVLNLNRKEGKRPAVFLRFKNNNSGEVRVYPDKLQVSESFCTIPVTEKTTVADLINEALERFGLQNFNCDEYRCSEILLDRGVTERVLSWDEKPWEIVKQLGKDSIRQMELMRFYIQLKQDPHGPNLALFIGNLPPNLSERSYENMLIEFLGKENKFSSIGPIYYEFGSMVIIYEDSNKAVRALYTLRESKHEDKHLLVMLLPNVEPSMVPSGVQPLLIFVNLKSGGCQGPQLLSSFRKLLNPYQVFDLENGGPLPGLYVFRHIKDYKILVCGGDGTIGWVLQCLDNVGQDSECSSPACAIVPLGTGNDLARTLCWGSGYTGDEDPLDLLRDVIDAEEIRLDRWTVVYHPQETDVGTAQAVANAAGASSGEDNAQMFVMNNYFGLGVDADLCLDFHNAREENPNKFKSRLRNKGVYVTMGLRKMVKRKPCKDLHKEIRLEVDGKLVDLPQVEGIIILNILNWGSGANPWGPDTKEDQFHTPNHWDGMLEVVGVTGVMHLGQIQSGLRTGMRIAQGGHIRMNLNSDIPVQVDGEPWIMSPGEVMVLKSALKATMLKKTKGKMKRRNTESSMQLALQAAPPNEPDTETF